MAIKYTIKRYSDEIKEEYQRRIVGFGIFNEDTKRESYIESILELKNIDGLSDEECIKIAFDQQLDSIKKIENTLISGSILGMEYVP